MLNPLMNALQGRVVADPRAGYRHALLVLTCALLAFAVRADAAPFDALDAAQRDEIADRCLPYLYGRSDTGPDALRACMERSSRSVAEPGLSLDEQHALRRLCGDDQDCQARERRELAALERSSLDRLPLDERDALQRHCRSAQDNDGPVAWNVCLQQAVAALQRGPALDRQALGFASRRAALSVCTDRKPADYRRCLRETGMPVAGAGATPVPASPGSASLSESQSEPGDTQAGDGTGAVIAGNTAEPDLKTRLLSSFEALDGTGRLLLLAAAFLPLLLWMARRLTHRRHAADAEREQDGYDEYAPLAGGARYDQRSSVDLDLDDDHAAHRATAGHRATREHPAEHPAAYGYDYEDEDEFADRYDEHESPSLWTEPPGQRLPDQLHTRMAQPSNEHSRFEGEADRLSTDMDANRAHEAFEADMNERPPSEPMTVPFARRPFESASEAYIEHPGDPGSDPRSHPPTDPEAIPSDGLRVELHDESRDELPHDWHDAWQDERQDESQEEWRAGSQSDSPTELPTDSAAESLDSSLDESLDEPRAESRAGSPVESPVESPTVLIDPLPRHDGYAVMAGDPGAAPDDESLIDERAETDALDASSSIDADVVLPVSSAFGAWLNRQPSEARLMHAVEFLVYWMAYGDKRYDDAARDALLARTDKQLAEDLAQPHREAREEAHQPVSYEQEERVRLAAERAIKRWVLREDLEAFADAVQWMMTLASPDQRHQALRLLIALLIPDAAPTPVQNTLMRFLADAFGLQARGLEALWLESFEAPLPPLPRVDRADWWATQDESALAERDARRVASYPATHRHAARLGLPLRGPYEAARVRAASRLAIQRTEPEGFLDLGERATTLAVRQLQRIEQARDALLEEALP